MAAGCGLRSPRPRPSLTWAAARQPAAPKARRRDAAQHRGPDFSICAGWPETPPRRSDVSSSATSARLLRFLQLPASGLSHQVQATCVPAAATAVSPRTPKRPYGGVSGAGSTALQGMAPGTRIEFLSQADGVVDLSQMRPQVQALKLGERRPVFMLRFLNLKWVLAGIVPSACVVLLTLALDRRRTWVPGTQKVQLEVYIPWTLLVDFGKGRKRLLSTFN